MPRLILLSLVCVCASLLAGCGNKGPLYMPSAHPPTKHKHKTTAQPAMPTPVAPAPSSTTAAPAASSTVATPAAQP